MRELNGAEALFGFLCWLTLREEPVTFSRDHDAAVAVQLFEHFCQYNAVGELSDDWPQCLTPVGPRLLPDELPSPHA